MLTVEEGKEVRRKNETEREKSEKRRNERKTTRKKERIATATNKTKT